jgi:hypothetical protein
MKLEKKHYIIIGVILVIVLVWYFLFRKKKENSLLKVSSNKLKGIAFIPGQAPGVFKPTGKESGTGTTAVQDAAENSFRGGHGGHHGGHGHHGGYYGGRGGWGYPLGWGYPYYDDEPIIIKSARCPEDWVWMGAMIGCVKPQKM